MPGSADPCEAHHAYIFVSMPPEKDNPPLRLDSVAMWFMMDSRSRPPSSSGLGYLVLSQGTGVRVPVGVLPTSGDAGTLASARVFLLLIPESPRATRIPRPLPPDRRGPRSCRVRALGSEHSPPLRRRRRPGHLDPGPRDD